MMFAMREQESSQRRYAEFSWLYLGDFRKDIPIYSDLAAKYPGPVLDVGCGAGRVTAHLAAAGHEVHAIDNSRPMLEVAHAHLRPWASHTRVYDFDLRHQPIAERFPVSLVTLHTFNYLIDVEEQRLFLRHLRESLASPGVVALDLFCPLSLMRPQGTDQWRQLDRTVDGHQLNVRDRREMLTPLLERRTQVIRVDGGPEIEIVTHRRYVPLTQLADLMREAGFESLRWIEAYDTSTTRPVDEGPAAPGPYMLLGEV